MSVNSSLTLWRNNPKGGAFSPSDLSGLLVQVQQELSLTDVDGVYRTQPEDTGSYFEQTTGSQKPSIATGSEITGIQGDDIDDKLLWGPSPGYYHITGVATFGVVVEIPAWDNNGFLVRTGNNGYGIYVNSAGSLFTRTTTSTGTIATGLSISLNTKHRVIVTRDASNNVRGWVDGVEVTSGSPTAGGTYTLQGLNGRYNSGFKVNADIVGRAFAYEADHTASIADLDSWLNATSA